MNTFMKITQAVLGTVFLAQINVSALAAEPFDPSLQPLGRVGDYALNKPGLADGLGKIYRPYFDQIEWWGELESRNVSSTGVINQNAAGTIAPNWSAKTLLDAMTFSARKIHVHDVDAANSIDAVVDISGVGSTAFALTSAAFQAALVDQATFDYVRGDRTNEAASGNGGALRDRLTILGDFINSTPVFVEYNSIDNDKNRIYIGGNDGMLHIFNAASGAEVAAFIPAAVVSRLKNLADPIYKDAHEYFVDGQISVTDVDFGDGNGIRKVLVGGLGAGGQAYYALDITGAGPTPPSFDLTGSLLWEINDSTAGYTNLGYSYSRPIITQVNVGTPAAPSLKWVVIVGNGYGNKNGSASGTATLLVIDLATGNLLKELDTEAGTNVDTAEVLDAVTDAVITPAALRSPNGLSDPAAVDVNADGITDYVYAGDLDGNVWRFDLDANNPRNASSTDLTDLWSVAFDDAGTPAVPQPLAVLRNNTTTVDPLGQRQAITSSPRILRHPDTGLNVVVATGRMLSINDLNSTLINSFYGLKDRLDGTKPDMPTAGVPGSGSLIVQDLDSTTYSNGGTSVRVRVSSNRAVDSTDDGWLVDLPQGERVITALTFRSGRILFSSINPTLFDLNGNTRAESWTMEINHLTGGAPVKTIYDINGDDALTNADNVDYSPAGTGNNSLADPEDRVTGLFQGAGIVISGPVLATIGSDRGTFFVNRLEAEVAPIPTLPTDPGLVGGHFDLDTTKLLSTALPQGSATTDGHIHQYDDKFNVKGADYFNMLDAKLNNISTDITDTTKHFKLVILNADKSPGGRLVINKAYDQTLASPPTTTYQNVIEYSNLGTTGPNNASKTMDEYLESLPIFSVCANPPQATAPGNAPLIEACPIVTENLTTDNSVNPPVTRTSTKLSQLGIFFDVLAILNGELVPTQTGCIKANIPSTVISPATIGDWRNSSLTIWALEVDQYGKPMFELILDPGNNKVVALEPSPTSGASEGALLWESTLFWHWKGGCAHEYSDLNAEVDMTTGVPVSPGNIIINPTNASPTYFNYWANVTISAGEKKDGGRDSLYDDIRKEIKDEKIANPLDGGKLDKRKDVLKDQYREELAQEKFGKSYDDLSKDEEKEIKDDADDLVDDELDRLTQIEYDKQTGAVPPDSTPPDGGNGTPQTSVNPNITNSPPGSLSNPNRVSWGERL